MTEKLDINNQAALNYHCKNNKPGKISMQPTKPLITQQDLALAYSPGVAAPCLAIASDPDKVYDYSAKANLVAVITNGTAVLGLGNIGPLAAKPVMEGKAVLFKRFADIDSFDIAIDTTDPAEFINSVKYMSPSFGGINLEDIKAPDCFYIERELQKLMPIPVFHDDQHGTAIITAAGLINAAHLVNKDIRNLKIVVNGAGAAGISCIELFIELGVRKEQIILCDTLGVIYKERKEGMNEFKELYATRSRYRTLAEAMVGADVFIGLSAKGAVNQNMISSMAPRPIIFAMANPDPEIMPEEILVVRTDAIIATGRSDYNNQVNNVMDFPYIFRGALDVRASKINMPMKIAAAKALAELARLPVPDEVITAYADRQMYFSPDYIIPVPFDPRLITEIPVAVAKAAIESGVARSTITDFKDYKRQLKARLNPSINAMNLVFEKVHSLPKKIVFAEGEEAEILRAALLLQDNGYGLPIFVGRESKMLLNL